LAVVVLFGDDEIGADLVVDNDVVGEEVEEAIDGDGVVDGVDSHGVVS